MQKIFIIFLFLLSGIAGFLLYWYQHPSSSDTQTIQTFHRPALFVKQLAGDPEAGRKIFLEFCATCHGKIPAIDIHAPLIGDKKTWGALSKLGMPRLLEMTIKGAGAMPARGGCFECSDPQLREAIKYILKSSTSP